MFRDLSNHADPTQQPRARVSARASERPRPFAYRLRLMIHIRMVLQDRTSR